MKTLIDESLVLTKVYELNDKKKDDETDKPI